MEYKDPGGYIPIICLLYSWGSRFGVPSKVPLLLSLLASRAQSFFLTEIAGVQGLGF